MRPPSSSTFRMVPLLRPSASRTALGSVIWPRSATVASMANLRSMKYAKSLHTLNTILNPSYCADSQPPPARPPGFSRPPPQELSPHERFLRHPRQTGRQRQVLHLSQSATAGRERKEELSGGTGGGI